MSDDPDQISSLTFAAIENTSHTLARMLHLLSTRQDVQSKLRREIVETTHGLGNLEYGKLAALPYLDAVCPETLRL